MEEKINKIRKYRVIAIVVVCVLAVCALTFVVSANEPEEIDIITVPEDAKEIVVDEANVGDRIPKLGYFEVTWMKAEALEGYTPEEILGGFLQYEGGEFFEKALVGQIVMDRVNTEEKSLAEVLCDVRCFGIRADFWELVCGEGISEENLELAKLILKMAETNKDMTPYDGYMYGFIAGETDNTREYFLKGKSKVLETDHYLFYMY